MGNARRELAAGTAGRSDRFGSVQAFTSTIALAVAVLAGCGSGDSRSSESPGAAPVPSAVSETATATVAPVPAAPGWIVAHAEVPVAGRFVLREPQDGAGGAQQSTGPGSSLKPPGVRTKQALGDPCTVATMVADCGAGVACVDGVCCNEACGGGSTNDCRACSIAAGGTANGTCTDRAVGVMCNLDPGGANLCTPDVCGAAGICAPGAALPCTAIDQCHSTGTCNPATGICSAPVVANGTACNDGSLCTSGETCQTGVCTPGTTVTCTAPDQCHLAGTCNPATGVCSIVNSPDGTGCNDSNACTGGESCQLGVCTPMTVVTCPVADACKLAGVCDPASGSCVQANRPNGTACDDSNMCTLTDTCVNGTCTAGTARPCDDSNACTTDACVPATGCANVMIPACVLDAGVDATPDLPADLPPDLTPDLAPDVAVPDVAPEVAAEVTPDRQPDTTDVRPPDTTTVDMRDTSPTDTAVERPRDTAPDTVATDTAIARDAPVTKGVRVGGGGCDCEVGGERTGGMQLTLLVGLALVLVRFRRRRR